MFAFLPLLLSLALAAHAQNLNPILPSNPEQCSTITVTWTASGTESQFYAARIVNPALAGGADADHDYAFLGHGNGTTSMEYLVGLPAGTEIALAVTDDHGNRECVNFESVEE